MQKVLKPGSWLLLCLFLAGITGIAWQASPEVGRPADHRDTVPAAKQGHVDKHETVINGDIDKALESLEGSMKQLQHQDWQKMQGDLQNAMQQLNADAMQKQMDIALLQLDAQKLQLDAQKTLQRTDWQEMEKDIQKGINEAKDKIDAEKLQDQLHAALESARKAVAELQQAETDRINAGLAQARNALKQNRENLQRDLAKARSELKVMMQRDWQKEMENANSGMHQAKEELTGFKTMLTEMEQEGLLRIKDGYVVEYRKGKLSINGREQPEEIADKYRHYFKKDNTTLRNDKDR